MGGNHYDRSMMEKRANRFHITHDVQAFVKMAATAKNGTNAFSDGSVEEPAEKCRKESLRKAESGNLESADDFFRIPVYDLVQDVFSHLFGFGILPVEGFFNKPFTDPVPELPLIGRVNFPGVFLDADAFLVNGFDNDIREIPFVAIDQAPEGKFVNFP